ncbi:uncharacterized protein LOC106868334 [Octopus bimaculoides]|uniref:Uncharacterized protein n=1 Tax=Octopus bimaculoides TaxID=37653 RepID=A0A0L8HVM4_OCTBM|nr:uncharacterized protein LOC106868334 [Octopus bimaculoides]|eukprot:XP_014769025.1 PREDICTED: uncharacterized protein LOC106868334 [Octopus bimaculoides]
METSKVTFKRKAYKVKVNKENLIKDLDRVYLNQLVDFLITKDKLLHFKFENNHENYSSKEIIEIILKKIEEDDSLQKTHTYDMLIEFLQNDSFKKHIVGYLVTSPGIDPVIEDCFTEARNISLDDYLLPKILVTISGNWNSVLKALDIENKDYSKELAFKMWFNCKGYKDRGLLTLLETLHSHSKDCSVDWNSMKLLLKGAKKKS